MEESVKNTVLYVDDEEHNLMLFDLIFSEKYNVITTVSTAEAREILARENVEVVISDLRMPEESGLDFINNVSPQYPNICFIILTAYLDVNSAMQAINQGHVYRYLLKPWNNNEITQAISNALDNYKLKTENEKLFNVLKQKNTELERALNDLKERENQFHNIFYSSIDGIMIFNRNLHIVLANPAFYNVFYNGEIVEKELHELLDKKNLEIVKERFNAMFSKQQDLTTMEYELRTPNGERLIIEANSALIKYAGEEMILSILRDITERKNLSQRILNEIVQAEDKERTRLASDLHDGLGPILSTLKMYIEWLSDNSRNGNKEQILELSYKTIQEAINQLRAISHNLSPHILEKFGLIPALQSQLDMMKATSRTQFNLHSNVKDRLPSNIENAVYRIIKECINNTIKHSGAKSADIEIEYKNSYLSIRYKDNGKGFDLSEITATGKGMGLYSIQNRVKSINGEVVIESQIDRGINVDILVQID